MNHYATLGLEPGATAEEIRAAYRREISIHHPDRGSADGGVRAAEITSAYRCLKNSKERRAYDRENGFETVPTHRFDPMRKGDFPPPPRRPVRHATMMPPARSSWRAPPSVIWLLLITFILTLPFLYGIWINGY